MARRSSSGTSRFIVLALILQSLVLSVAIAQTQGVVETKLDNGLTVLMKEVHAAPVFTAQVWFKVGSRNEHTGITGGSHLVEHMLFNTSKNFKKGEITNLIRKRGGIENAATSTDYTYYWQLLSSEHLDFALKTLAERVGNALLLEPDFRSERTVVLSEMEGHENDPDRLLYHALMETAFVAHPYQWPIIGFRSDVENIDRGRLYEYYRAYYHPNNATLVLVGDFDKRAALSLVKKYFGAKPPARLPRPVYTTEPVQRGERRVTIRREGNAERVLMGYHVPALVDMDSYALIVLDQILSGGRASRLYQALVEKQLATSAWSSAGGRKDPSLFMLSATARRGVTGATLENALLEQVERAKTTLPTEAEMQAAKNQLEAYFIFQNDSVSDQGEQLGYYNTLATWRYLDTLIPKIEIVTAEQVQEVARKYLTSDNLTVATFIPGGNRLQVTGYRLQAPRYAAGTTSMHDLPDSPLCKFPQQAGVGSGPSAPPSIPSLRDSKTLAKPHREVLDNGIVVIVQENHSNPTVAISGNLKAGSYFDAVGKSGVASLVAEMIGRGTKKRSALQLAQEVEFVGASLGASANTESVRFSAKSLAKDFPLMLDILSDELRNASFPEDQFERAKGETLSALEQSKESTESVAFRAFYHAAFPKGHPYHDLTIEDALKELGSIARENLTSFYHAYYRPDTTIIVIVGDVSETDAIEQIRRYFGDWKAEGPAPQVDISTIGPSSEANKIVVPMMDKSQVDVVFGYPLGVKRSDPDYYAVRIMNQILGGGGALGSILGDVIRENKGLVYNVYSTFDASLGAGAWYASLGTGSKTVDQAVETLKSEIAKFKAKGATKEQYLRAREFIVGVFPITLETNEGIARALTNAEFYGLGLDYLRNVPRIYRSVTLDQVNAAARKYLHPDTATLVIAGPCEK